MPGERSKHLSPQGTPTVNASNATATLVGTPSVERPDWLDDAQTRTDISA